MSKTKKMLFFDNCYEFLTTHLRDRLFRSPKTIIAYTDALSLFRKYTSEEKMIAFDDLFMSTITVDFMLDFRVWLIESRKEKPQTANHRFGLVRSYIKYCSSQNVTLLSIYLKINDIPPLRYDKPREEAMTEEAVKAILRQPENTRKGIRNLTFMVVLYEIAARVSELINLRIENLFLDDNLPHVIIRGKGKKTRSIPLTKPACEHIKYYMSIYHKENSVKTPLLFYNITKGVVGPLSHDCISTFLHKYADMAREECPEVPENVHSHLFRRSKATHLSNNGIGLPIISRYLGHSDITTTMVYVRPNQKKIQEALESVGQQALPTQDLEEYDKMRAKLCGLR
jgi:site-specific recombinase XerD